MNHRKLVVSLLVFASILGATALSCSSAGNLPNPFASPTPTATATFTPTVTPSPTPTTTPTSTPLPTGITIRPQSSGLTLVHDWDNGYELTLPADWRVVSMTEEDLAQIIAEVATQDPQFSQMADAYEQISPDLIRVVGLNQDRKYMKADYPTMLVISARRDALVSSLPMEAVTAIIEDRVLPESTDTTWDVKHNAHGIDVGIVEGSQKMRAPNGSQQNVKVKVIGFQASQKLILLEFVTPAQFGAEVLPGLDQIVDTIQLTEP